MVLYMCRAMMTLTRGGTSLFPCPVCLVPKKEIPNLSKSWPRRTTQSMRDAWQHAQTLALAAQQEEYLRGFGLRDVEVALF